MLKKFFKQITPGAAWSGAVDPDGSAFIFPPGSGSTFNIQIRIQEGKK